MLFSLLSFFNSNQLFGQEKFTNNTFDTSKTYIVELHDGSQLIGKFLQKDSIYIVIKTSSIPKIEIPVQQITSIKEIDPSNLKNGIYWFPNPNATRYFFAPSSFCLKKGEWYYQNTYLFFNLFNVGITNHISIGGGFEFLSTFGSLTGGNFDPIFFFTPKVGFKVLNKFNAGSGILYASVPGFDSANRTSLGIVYGIGTYGSIDHNITGGLGWGFVEGEFERRPIIAISGMTRIAKKTSLITENWFIPTNNYYGLISYGIRFFGEKLAVDLAFVNSRDIIEEFFIGLPYIDFVVKF
jgi:hypothetical protein